MDESDYGLTPDIKRGLDAELAKIDTRCTRLKLKSRGLEPDGPLPTLFHYTSAEAIRKILTSKSLWATHAQFLSDRTEFRYGIRLVRKLLSVVGRKDSFLCLVMELLETWLGDPDSEPYIVSFSSDGGNRLSQRMIYGDRGEGFSTGFEYEKLRHQFREIVVARVLPVTYDPKVHKQILATEINGHWRVRERAVSKWPTLQKRIDQYCQINLVSLLVTECTAFKHPGFKEEQEFRLIARRKQGRPKPEFRAGRFGITPYLDLKSPNGQKLPVVKITQGPTADRESAQKGIEMLLADLGYEGVAVEVSDIPQR